MDFGLTMMWFPVTCRICKGPSLGKRVLFFALVTLSLFTYVAAVMLHRNYDITRSASTEVKVEYQPWSNHNMTIHTSRHHRKKNVLLFGYMRGGSSLVGHFYRNSPGVFYVFEPLIPLAPYNYFTETSLCKMRDDSCQFLNNSSRNQEAISTISNLYSCHIRDIPKIVIDKIIAENKSSESWWHLRQCLNGTLNITNKRQLQCFDDIERACQRAEVRVFKILRLGFEHMRLLLQDIPSLYVLFLVRDPRAILNSRISTDWFPVKGEDQFGVVANVNSLCKKMYNDILFYEQTRVNYIDKMVQMNIEKITENEEEMMKLMHNFRDDYKIQQEDRSFIDSTFQKKNDSSLFRDWRRSLESMYVTYTEQRCSDVISYLDKQTKLLSPGLTLEY